MTDTRPAPTETAHFLDTQRDFGRTARTTRGRLFRDEVASLREDDDEYLVVLDTPVVPFFDGALTSAEPLATWEAESRADLIEQIRSQAPKALAESGRDLDYELIEPPYETYRCRVLSIPSVSAPASYFVTIWDQLEYPESHEPEGAALIASFQSRSPRAVRAWLDTFTEAARISIRGAWRAESTA